MEDLTHYIEIEIKPNPDITLNFIMSILIKKIHESFILNKQNLGISFPFYAKNLGSKVRIFGDEASLTKFNSKVTINNISSYLVIKPINKVPDNVSYGRFIRVRTKTKASVIKRAIVRKNIDKERANSLYKNFIERALTIPFINYHSSSTNQYTKIFIKFVDNCEKNNTNEFSSFGLSKGDSVVPIF